MTEEKRLIEDMAKLLTEVRQESKRLLTEAQQENERLRTENKDLRDSVARWQNTFIAFAEQHFAQGGKAPNLPMAAISCTVAPTVVPFEMINNNDYVTVVIRR